MQFYVLQSQAFTATTSSQVLYQENPNRVHFSIQNRGSDNIYVHFGEEDATSSNGILVASGVLYEPVFPGRGAITVIADASVNCVATEG